MPRKKSDKPRKRGRPPKDPKDHRPALVTTVSPETFEYIKLVEKEMGLSRGRVLDLFAEVFRMANAQQKGAPRHKTKEKPATKK